MTRSAIASRTARLLVLAMGASLTGTAAAATTAEYPGRAIRLIIPFATGSATDTSARLYAVELNKQMGPQVLADNRQGAGGANGMQMLAKSAADGYTLVSAARHFESRADQPEYQDEHP